MFPEGRQTDESASRDIARGLDLDRSYLTANLEHEIDFHPVPRPVVGQCRVRPETSEPAMELVPDEVLQEEASLIIERTIQRPAKQRVPNAEIEDEDLRMSDEAGPVGTAPGRDPEGHEGVLQHLQIPAAISSRRRAYPPTLRTRASAWISSRR
jgi:hypothetical protein